MKQNQLTLLLCILIALFLNNVYMYSNDYSWTCSGSTTFSTTGSSLNGVTWIASVTGSSAGTGVSGEKCVQIAKNTSLTLTTSDFKGKNITKVTLQTWGSSGNSFTITNGSYTSTTTIHTSYSTSGATISFDNVGASTESLKFEWKSASKAFNIRQIKITYEESSTETTPSITQHPKSATYDQGATPAALTITASGSPDPTYQWYSNTSNNNSNGTAISGATEASYTPSTATAGTFYYYCVATNSKGSTSSDVATITVNTITTYTVLWSLGGAEYTEGSPTTSVKSGEKVSTLPTRPANNAIGVCANTFMGWSAHNLGSKTGQDAPKDLFTTAEGSPVITQDTTFYAVFATGTTN